MKVTRSMSKRFGFEQLSVNDNVTLDISNQLTIVETKQDKQIPINVKLCHCDDISQFGRHYMELLKRYQEKRYDQTNVFCQFCGQLFASNQHIVAHLDSCWRLIQTVAAVDNRQSIDSNRDKTQVR